MKYASTTAKPASVSSKKSAEPELQTSNDEPTLQRVPASLQEGASAKTPALNSSQVLQLQRSIGNQATRRIIAQQRESKPTPASNTIQRAGDLGDKGLVKLAEGVEGEVGLEGSVDKGARLFPAAKLTNNSQVPLHTFGVKTKAYLHDIGNSDWLWAQVPAIQQASPTADLEKEASNKLIEKNKAEAKPTAAALGGLVRKKNSNRGGLRHKTVEGPIFPRDPKPEDILQGGLGDCFFLASLASIAATRPDHIKSMISDSGDGTVSVRFYKITKPPMGEKTFQAQYVTVRKAIAQTMFGSRIFTSGNTIWPALIEKAYAAWENNSPAALPGGFKGTYGSIEGGHSSDAWEQILGVPSVKQDIKKNPNDQEFATPWNNRIVSDVNDVHSVVADDSLTSIAAHYGLTPKELRDYNVKSLDKPELARMGFGKKAALLRAIGDSENLAAYNFTFPGDSKVTKAPVTLNIPSSNDKELAKIIPTMPQPDRTKWITYLKSVDDASDLIRAHQKITDDPDASDKITGITSMDFIEGLAAKAKLSEAGTKALLKYCAGIYEGTPSKPETYSTEAVKLFTQIRSALKAGRFVGLGSMNWGKGEGNAGENTDKVAGIVGGHAFSVIDTEPSSKSDNDDIAGKPLFVVIRNPWGRFGRGYDENFKAKEIEAGQYRLEITDVRRFFSSIYYTDASVEQMMRPRRR